MSQSSLPPDPTDDLQFTTAEPGVSSAGGAAAPGRNCLACKRPITSMYYAVRDKIVCPDCYDRAMAPPAGSGFGRFVKATVLGIGAGLVGAAIWFAIRRAAHLEIGLVAILVGYMVGKAVRKGSGGRGGRGYQVLAVVLTYSCIAANYMPDIFEGLSKAANENRVATDDTAAGTAITPPAQVDAGRQIVAVALLLALVFAVSLAAPFLAGVQNLIGLLIIAFALWQAWKLTAPRRLAITGPYQIGAAPASPGRGIIS